MLLEKGLLGSSQVRNRPINRRINMLKTAVFLNLHISHLLRKRDHSSIILYHIIENYSSIFLNKGSRKWGTGEKGDCHFSKVSHSE
jgi:hypothetical protein